MPRNSKPRPGMDVVVKSIPDPAITATILPARKTPLAAAFTGLSARLKSIRFTLSGGLFGLALVFYIATRLIGLVQFPIYFFTDEAIQTVSAGDLVHNGFRSPDNILLPTYFENGSYYNLSTSVYLQVLPTWLFGKSEFATRATAALMTVLAAVAVSLALKTIFKNPYWWSGALLLALAPAWFLHSRTAFETALFGTFYAMALLFYLLYRNRSPRYLFPAILFLCLAFYTYSPGQVVVAVTAVLLALSDLPYHWKNKWIVVLGLLLLALLALPYLRFRLWNNGAPVDQLRELNSYWIQPGPFSAKLGLFARQYLHGLDWRYWFVPELEPNLVDLPRHIMKGWGNLMPFTLPFFVIGLFMAFWNIHSSAHRTLLVAVFAAPTGAALVALGITRILVFTIPATLLIALGISKVLSILADPARWFRELRPPEIFGKFGERGKRLAGTTFSSLLSKVFHKAASRPLRGWTVPLVYPSILLFVILAAIGSAMTHDALVNGPTWYTDYGLGGMQWSAPQVFGRVQEYLADHPGTRILLTPDWSNGTDIVARFFLPDGLPVDLGSVIGHINWVKPLDDNLVFVMLASDLEDVRASGKFKDILIDEGQTIYYPDGSPGFFFVRLRYVDNIEQVFAVESESRRQLLETTLPIDGQMVKVRYSRLDIGEIALLFDKDPYNPARTAEANPFVVELTFPQPRQLSGISVIIGSLQAEVTVSAYSAPEATPEVFTITQKGSVDQPEITLDFGKTVSAQILRVEVRDVNNAEPANVHIWELTLKP